MDNPGTLGSERALPPGTVYLIHHENSSDSSSFVLYPVPSSDPNDPLNWSKTRKYVNYGLIMTITIAVFTNLALQTIFWQQMTVDLHVTISDLNHAQSTQLAGLATGCIFVIPYTVKYGRRLTYLVSTAVLAAAAWWTSSIHSYPELIITSLITGLAGAINETAVQMTIADIFFLHERGSANGLYFIGVMVGTFLTPLIAGVQATAQGWRWSYYTLAIALTVIFVLFLFFYEETKYIPITEGRPELAQPATVSGRDDAVSIKPGSVHVEKGVDELAHTQSGLSTDIPMNTYRQRMRLLTPTPESIWQVMKLPLHIVFFPHVMFTALQFASGICWLVMMMSVISIVFSAPPYHFDPAQIGMMALGPFVGNIFGSAYGGPFADWLVMRLTKKNGGVFEPEMRLYPLILPVIFMTGGIIMFGATADRHMHWIFPAIGGAFFAFGLGANGDITFTLVIDSYRELTAEAFVGVAFIRNVVSIALPFALVPWMTSMGLTNMFILSGMLAFVIGLLFVPLIIWGKKIRTAWAPRYWQLVDKRSEIFG